MVRFSLAARTRSRTAGLSSVRIWNQREFLESGNCRERGKPAERRENCCPASCYLPDECDGLLYRVILNSVQRHQRIGRGRKTVFAFSLGLFENEIVERDDLVAVRVAHHG